MSNPERRMNLSRRMVLRSAAVGTAGLALVGTAGATGDSPETGFKCGYDDPIRGSDGHAMAPYHDACADDHPETKRLREDCRDVLDRKYPNVGALVADGYIPYFDKVIPGPEFEGYSHWLNPEYIDNGAMLDPERPESVLVDNNTWCPIGVMFIADAGAEGDPVYVECDEPDAYDHDGGHHGHDHDESGHDEGHHGHNNSDHEHENSDHEHEGGDDCVTCAPWHGHTDLPARFAWWYYRQVYDRAKIAEKEVNLWCVTPAMLHVWTVAHPGGVYAHPGPPNEYRPTGQCVPDTGFGQMGVWLKLTLNLLPRKIQRLAMPSGLQAELDAIAQMDDERAFESTIEELERELES